MPDKGGFISNIVVFIAVRCLYFLGGFLALGVGSALLLGFFSRRRMSSSYDIDGTLPAMLLFEPVYWYVIAALSLMVAIFGPIWHQRRTMRGRGRLRELREDKVFEDD